MEIKQILSSVGTRQKIPHTTLYLSGAVETHEEDGTFRVYPDGGDRRRYFIVNTTDVVGDVYKWTEAELAARNFVAQERFRIGIKNGAPIEAVTVELHRLGETIAGDDARTEGAARGTCHYTTGCNSQCCTTASDGKCYCDSCCVA